VWFSTGYPRQKNLVLEKGKITGLQVAKMRLTEADSSGRKGIEEIKNSEEFIAADMVIGALGFEPEELPTYFNEPDLKVTKWGTIKAHATTAMTSIDGVFAAGDIVRGASLVVWALKDGKEAAGAIHNYLKAKA